MLGNTSTPAHCGFNLSILECKYLFLVISPSSLKVLIYPYWNVNAIVVKGGIDWEIGFNLSILECKLVFILTVLSL